MRKTPAVLAASLVLAAAAARAGEAGLAFRVEPYLQNPSDTGMTVMWVTTAPSTGTVEFGTTRRLGRRARASSTAPDIGIVRLDGLRPGRRHFYRVRVVSEAGEEAMSGLGEFRTLSPRASVVRAVFYNDIHGRLETFRALTARLRGDEAAASAAQARVEGFGHDVAFLNGDCWQDPGLEQRNGPVLDNLAAYTAGAGDGRVPMILARGNHEYRGSYSVRLAELFDMPMLDRGAGIGEQKWYSAFTHGPVRFVVLDCGEDFKKRIEVFQPYRRTEAEWLAREVASEPFREAPFRVLVMHIPLFNDNEWTSEPTREIWEPILKGARVDLAVCAHDHTPKLLDPRSGRNAGRLPFPVIIGGGPEPGKGTVITLEATAGKLVARSMKADGTVVNTFEADARPR